MTDDTFNVDEAPAADETAPETTDEETTPAEDTTEPVKSFDGEPQIGTFVVYTSGKGKSKPALVLGTSESVTDGSSLQKPKPGHLYLRVYSPAGSEEYKKRVPHTSLVEENVRVWS